MLHFPKKPIFPFLMNHTIFGHPVGTFYKETVQVGFFYKYYQTSLSCLARTGGRVQIGHNDCHGVKHLRSRVTVTKSRCNETLSAEKCHNVMTAALQCSPAPAIKWGHLCELLLLNIILSVFSNNTLITGHSVTLARKFSCSHKWPGV